MGIRIPNGIRAEDLPDPVAGAQAEQDAVQAAAQQVANTPSMVAPQSIPTPSPSPSTPPVAPAPAEDPAAALIAKYSDDLMAKYGGTEQQGPPEAQGPITTALAGTGLQSQGQLVRRPAAPNKVGEFAVLEPDGKLRELSAEEKVSLNKISEAIRAGGPLVAGLFGGAIGAGVGVPNLGAAVAGTAASNALEPVASPLHEAATGSPLPARTVGQNLVEAGAGTVAGAALEGFAGQSRTPPVAAAREALQGAESLAARASERAKAVEAAGGSAAPEQINVGSRDERIANLIREGRYGDALRAQQEHQQLAREQAYVEQLQRLRDQYPEPAMGEGSPRNVISSMITGNRKEIAALNKEVYQAAGQKAFDAQGLDKAFTSALDRRTILNPDGTTKALSDLSSGDKKLLQEYQRFVNIARPGDVVGTPATKPSTARIQEMDRLIERLRDNANFDAKLGNTPEERTFQRLYHEAVITRDTAAARAAEEAGQPLVAKALRQSRDNYANFIDGAERIQQALKNDPDNFTKAIVKKDQPELLRDAKSALTPEAFNQVKGQFLSNLMDGIDLEAKKINASTMDKTLKSYGESTLKELYSPEELKKIRTLINYGKVIERKNFASQGEAAKDQTVKAAVKLATTGKGIGDFALQLYYRTAKSQAAKDYFANKIGIPKDAEAFAAEAGSPQKVVQGTKEATIGDLVRNPAFRGAGAATAGALSQRLASEVLGYTGLRPPQPTPEAQ